MTSPEAPLQLASAVRRCCLCAPLAWQGGRGAPYNTGERPLRCPCRATGLQCGASMSECG